MPSHGRFKQGCIMPVLTILMIAVIALFLSFSSCSVQQKANWNRALKQNSYNGASYYPRGGYTYTYGSDGTRYRTYRRYSSW